MVNPGTILGSVKNNLLLKELMAIYQNSLFINSDNTFNLKTAPQILTELLLKKGLVKNDEFQIISGITIYPKEYFCPKSWVTKEMTITPNTHTIHHFEESWISNFQKIKNSIKNLIGYE